MALVLLGRLTFPCVDSDGLLSTTDSSCRRLDHQESHITDSQAGRAIELPTSGIIHVADPNNEFELQRSMNVVHLKTLEFGIAKPVRKWRSDLVESHVVLVNAARGADGAWGSGPCRQADVPMLDDSAAYQY
jgi:hypothetical protein